MSRFQSTFAKCANENRAALITYIMASDPDHATSQAILNGMPEAGADIIELGMPFSDPMADGPVIQAAANRALASDGSVKKTIQMVKEFRKNNQTTPIVLMGYYNPIHHHGLEAFARDTEDAGVDGFIIVDLPPEEENEFIDVIKDKQLDLIRLTSPTTDEARAPVILRNASGFVYYISVAGITGSSSGTAQDIGSQVSLLKRASNLPVAVGFGIKTPEQAANMADMADGIVVGSALVAHIANNTDSPQKAVDAIFNDVKALNNATIRQKPAA